ncbi:MAG: endonuclease MutS2, partial [Chloroflexi bacterium]|nr:endonuclease MutS2 [Chloroflexota bacterium]
MIEELLECLGDGDVLLFAVLDVLLAQGDRFAELLEILKLNHESIAIEMDVMLTAFPNIKLHSESSLVPVYRTKAPLKNRMTLNFGGELTAFWLGINFGLSVGVHLRWWNFAGQPRKMGVLGVRNMDEKSLSVLEFPKVREIVAGFTAFPMSRELALSLTPITDHEEIILRLKESAEARRLLAVNPNLSIGEIIDIRQAAALAAREKVLDLPTLVDIRSTLTAVGRFRAILANLKDDAPRLWSIAERIVPLPHLEEEIGRCIDPAGELLATASPKLAALREELKHARQQLVVRLEGIMRTLSAHNVLQEALITERAGRYVVPVKTEFQGRVKGIIHDVSNTGATVFIEPWTIVEMGNTLRQLALEEEREVQRILVSLSAGVGECEVEISRNLSIAAQLDFALAKARYARMARAAEPRIVPDGEEGHAGSRSLNLVDARHPLLRGSAVPLSIEIGKDFSGLVITGPNTGGKTVALKTIGLLVLMAESGLPIPASGDSSIPVFDNVFADIGDEQSIEQTLSTFSWHMGNIVRITRISTPKSLVLLDELAASTDPAEGAALGRAILLYFLARRTFVAATTHYSELKVFAHSTPGLQNASLVFDPVTLKPTYHLVVGIPGGSNALAVAAQLGLPGEVVASAREMLPGGTTEIEALLKDLTREKDAAQALRAEIEKERATAALARSRVEEELRGLAERKAEIIREARDEAARAMAGLHREIRAASAELKRKRSKEGIEKARAALDAAREQLAGQAKDSGASEGSPVAEIMEAGRIAVGDSVRVIDTSLRGTVLSISEKGGHVEVQSGRTKIKVGLEDIEKVERAAEKPSKRPVTFERSPERTRRSMELDLRGKRAEEVEPELDAYLNDASLAGFTEVRVIHGYGTGTVRQIVRDMLASHPLVKS